MYLYFFRLPEVFNSSPALKYHRISYKNNTAKIAMQKIEVVVSLITSEAIEILDIKFNNIFAKIFLNHLSS